MTPNSSGGGAALETVAWRIKHPSEPGMIGHYPWSYSERVTKRVMGFDEEPLCRLTDASSAIRTLEERVASLEAERDAAERDGIVKRTRRIAALAGISTALPEDDATVYGALFACLGMIAGKLERDIAARPQPRFYPGQQD